MLIQQNLSLQEKLRILTDAAKYDVACTSSGVARKGKAGMVGNTAEAGICHSFSADGRCISLLKILFTNQCIYDCKYCINRSSNDTLRTAFTPDEVCRLTMEFYRRNYIEGLFLSSGILHNANYTMEQIYQTVYSLRTEHRFNGYIHIKAIPGADEELIERIGFLADRMSVNLELPTTQGLKNLAPGKTRDKILRPMRQIQRGIFRQQKLLEELSGERKRLDGRGRAGFTGGASLFRPDKVSPSLLEGADSGKTFPDQGFYAPSFLGREQRFVPAGQSTQMIVGATPENDYQMMKVTEALYQSYGLKRVFFSAFVRVNEDSSLPALLGGPPLLREHRLYQADWLLRFYGFQADELLTEDKPDFNVFLDPKCDWALRHLELFPVEVNRAEYQTLLRVPGIGVKSAGRILAARRNGALDFATLKKLGVVLKRAVYFITCSGRMEQGTRLDQDFITSCLIGDERRKNWDISHQDSYRQLSLFHDMKLEAEPTGEDKVAAVFGDM